MDSNLAQKILEQTKNNYDQLAVDWDRTRQYVSDGSQDFLQYIKVGDRVLDAGCGNGRLVKLFSTVNVKYVGLDNSQALLAVARKNFPQAKFVAGDILRLPFADQSFDAVFCVAALHHLPTGRLRRQALAEINRVLIPAGFLILLNWSWRSPKIRRRLVNYTITKLFKGSELDWGDIYVGWGQTNIQRYVHLFSQSGTKSLLDQTGYQVRANYVSAPTQRGFCNLVTIGQKC